MCAHCCLLRRVLGSFPSETSSGPVVAQLPKARPLGLCLVASPYRLPLPHPLQPLPVQLLSPNTSPHPAPGLRGSITREGAWLRDLRSSA